MRSFFMRGLPPSWGRGKELRSPHPRNNRSPTRRGAVMRSGPSPWGPARPTLSVPRRTGAPRNRQAGRHPRSDRAAAQRIRPANELSSAPTGRRSSRQRGRARDPAPREPGRPGPAGNSADWVAARIEWGHEPSRSTRAGRYGAVRDLPSLPPRHHAAQRLPAVRTLGDRPALRALSAAARRLLPRPRARGARRRLTAHGSSASRVVRWSPGVAKRTK